MIPITNALLDNYNRPGRLLNELRAIIIHWTANTHKGANAMANRNYFNTKPAIMVNGKKIYASAHYIIDDHTIVRCLPDLEVGYHVGSSKPYKDLVHSKLNIPVGDSPNNYTLGIEMCVNSDGDFSKTRQHTIELTNSLMNQYGIDQSRVLRHFDITGKDCPKMMLDEAIWEQFRTEVVSLNVISGQLKVNVSELNVRSGPGTNFPIKRVVHNGDVLQKLGQEGIWYRVGDQEWVHSNYILVL